MTDKDAPKIEFPCDDYPIKVIGRDEPGFRDLVIEVMQKHVVYFDHGSVTEQPSSRGSFISIRVKITATGVTQLKSIHRDLLATGRVKMVI